MTTSTHPIEATGTSHQLELSQQKRSWIEAAIPIVLECAADGDTFCADKWHACLPVPYEDNWFGILAATMKRRGLIERVGYQASTRPERNGAVVAVWRRKL